MESGYDPSFCLPVSVLSQYLMSRAAPSLGPQPQPPWFNSDPVAFNMLWKTEGQRLGSLQMSHVRQPL